MLRKPKKESRLFRDIQYWGQVFFNFCTITWLLRAEGPFLNLFVIFSLSDYNHISSISVILGLLDDYWGQRAFVDRESRVGREDNSMTVGIVCQDDRQAYQLIHSHIYPILFGLPQSTLDIFYLCHIFLRCYQIYWLALTFFVWVKALSTSQSFVYPLHIFTDFS